jgi:hypothetical protein
VRRLEDRSKWFLIDWEDSATPPTSAEPSFNKKTHSPAIFLNGHGAEVDIWAIGYLIRASKAVRLPVEMMRLGVYICEKAHELTAQEVLALLTK